jgi:dephospho-CoA kinase
MNAVGLTGGISTGKSTASNWLKEHSVPLIDADLIARQVYLSIETSHRIMACEGR